LKYEFDYFCTNPIPVVNGIYFGVANMTSKVLVVDDSPAELKNLTAILSDAGCVVTTASTGTEAVKKALSEKPSVIFMDVIMPDMDGFAATRELSNNAATKSIPVVFVTSKGQKADKVWAQMQGGKGYVTKPYTADQIVEQLKAVG
jgi:twitching motility two-component system response regulator PilH